MVNEAVSKLASYALRKGLIGENEYIWAVNTILDTLKLDGWVDPGKCWDEIELAPVLGELLDDARARGVLAENSVVYRDLFDTELMGRLTPRPAQVIEKFRTLYAQSPKDATPGYQLHPPGPHRQRRASGRPPRNTGTWTSPLTSPSRRRTPRAIAAARDLPASDYPRCQLCAENEGYAGRVKHPARQNHRVVPITINGSPWFLQYSPYVYYNEHCICLNKIHTPMKTDRACFAKLLDFVRQFPHYFVGSNADLPIVGGSILAHDHFQGGHYIFAMEKAPVETPFSFPGLIVHVHLIQFIIFEYVVS